MKSTIVIKFKLIIIFLILLIAIKRKSNNVSTAIIKLIKTLIFILSKTLSINNRTLKAIANNTRSDNKNNKNNKDDKN